MNLEFSVTAMRDYQYWKANHPNKARKIRLILEDVLKTPFTGIGKPEPLLFDMHGYWSRRIDKKNRLLYKVEGDRVIIMSCRYHYKK